MSSPQLESALRAVPYLDALGLKVEAAKPGLVVLRLPALPHNLDFEGGLHVGVLFSVGTLAAAVALRGHPHLVDVEIVQRDARITYRGVAHEDVTAHAEVPPEAIRAFRDDLEHSESASVEIPVRIMDGHGEDVAMLHATFGLRFR